MLNIKSFHGKLQHEFHLFVHIKLRNKFSSTFRKNDTQSLLVAPEAVTDRQFINSWGTGETTSVSVKTSEQTESDQHLQLHHFS